MAQSWQDYANWMASGAPGSQAWWTDAAKAAAEAAGVPFYHPDYTAGLWTSKTTPWGENILYNQAGEASSWVNPAWNTWVRNWMAQNQTAAAPPQPTGGPAQAAAPVPVASGPAAGLTPIHSRSAVPPLPPQPSMNAPAAPTAGSGLVGADRSRQALLSRLRRSYDLT